MNTPRLRTIETAGNLLALCGSRGITEVSTDQLIRQAGRSGLRTTECLEALEMLGEADLVRLSGDRLSLTHTGRKVSASQSASWRPYCLELLNMPWVQEVTAVAVSLFGRTGDGSLTFDRERLVTVSPQLTGLLTWLTREGSAANVLGSDVAERLLASAHLGVERPAVAPDWVQRAADVGSRAEYYTLHLERSRKPPGQVLHAAAESDRYGYDVEDRSVDPPQLIEVKGSAKAPVQFFLTSNERRAAAANQDTYLVQFWGQIDLRRSMASEYSILRASGYPIVIRGVAAAIEDGSLLAEPSEWLVTRPERRSDN